MASERLQRQIERLLDEAEQAIAQRDWAAVQERAEDVAAIYQSNDGDEVRRLLEKYQVRYVYLGHRERSSYGARYLAGFTGVDGILKTMFEQDGVIIYELAQRAIQPVPPVQPGDGGGPS